MLVPSIPHSLFLFQAMEVTTIVVDPDILEAEVMIGISKIAVISGFAGSRFSLGVGRKVYIRPSDLFIELSASFILF